MNKELIKALINEMEPAAVKKAVLALLDQEQKPVVKEQKPAAKKAGPKKKPFDTGKAVACYNAGWSIAKIADELGTSDPTVRKHLKDAGAIQ